MLQPNMKGPRMRGAPASRIRLALAALLVLAGSSLLSTAARADFRVCNATQSLVGVGIGYRAKAGWVTEGYVYPSYRALWRDLSSRPEG